MKDDSVQFTRRSAVHASVGAAHRHYIRCAAATLFAVAAWGTANPAAARCRLAPDDCGIVADRMEYLRRYEVRERARLNFLSPYQRNREASKRTSAEEIRIRDSLPPAVGREFIRLVGCDLREYGAMLDGKVFNDPACK